MTKARLCVFAALHDIGKVNIGFQTRIWQDEDLQGRRRPNWAGHTSDIVPVLQGIDWDTSDWFLKGIGWHEHIGNWDGGRRQYRVRTLRRSDVPITANL